MPLLDEKGLKTGACEPVLAAVLGNRKGEEGFKVVAEANNFGHAKVEVRDWLYCLVKAPGTRLRKFLVDGPGKDPDQLVDLLENALGDDDANGVPPSELTDSTVTPDVLTMLARAEEVAMATGKPRVEDDQLSLALLENAGADLKGALEMWAGKDRLAAFTKELQPRIAQDPGVDLFTANGDLNRAAFNGSGWRFCQRLTEELAAMGAEKVTTRHLLYVILGNADGAMAVALAMQNYDVKKELHSALSRELVRSGRKRNQDFKLSKESLFASVVDIFRDALHLAVEAKAKGMGEQDIHRAFLAKQEGELKRLMPREKPLDSVALRDYLRDFAPDESQSGPPIQRFTIQEIHNKINEAILGQEAAVNRVLPWIKRLRFGIPRDGRPAGVFLFLGPTGTGKTQMAKEIARYVYGNEEMMIFLEMGQFQSKESMSQFIGAPPGYIGYGEGKLTNGLRDKPESVVLFDEIEKANTQVFDTLLRFADEGLISDPAGPVRDGRKCIIVMTSNAGQNWLRAYLKDHPEAQEDPASLSKLILEAATKELQEKGYRPEFLGRVDEKITFLPFTVGTCRRIIDSVLGKETGKFQKIKQVQIDVTDRAREVMALYAHERSMDEGARGAPRAVNLFIVTPAIDTLSAYEDEDRPLPAKLIATVQGLSNIVLEEE